MKLFKPDDFRELHGKIQRDIYRLKSPSGTYEYDTSPDDIAELANKILIEYLESCPEVVQLEARTNYGWYEEKKELYKEYKRKARLVNIEEINKQPETLYVDSGITMNGEKLYNKEKK